MSQFEVGVNFGGPALLDWFANGVAAEPVGNDPPWESWTPHAIYPCAGDDQWCAIAVVADDQWRALCRLMEADDWLAADSLSTAEGRKSQRAEIDARIADWTADQDRYELMERCQRAGVARRSRADRIRPDQQRPPNSRRPGCTSTSTTSIPRSARSRPTRLALQFERTPATVSRRAEGLRRVETSQSPPTGWACQRTRSPGWRPPG